MNNFFEKRGKHNFEADDKCQITVIFHSTYRLVLHAIHYKNPQFDNIVYISKMYQKAITSIFYTFL